MGECGSRSCGVESCGNQRTAQLQVRLLRTEVIRDACRSRRTCLGNRGAVRSHFHRSGAGASGDRVGRPPTNQRSAASTARQRSLRFPGKTPLPPPCETPIPRRAIRADGLLTNTTALLKGDRRITEIPGRGQGPRLRGSRCCIETTRESCI